MWHIKQIRQFIKYTYPTVTIVIAGNTVKGQRVKSTSGSSFEILKPSRANSAHLASRQSQYRWLSAMEMWTNDRGLAFCNLSIEHVGIYLHNT